MFQLSKTTTPSRQRSRRAALKIRAAKFARGKTGSAPARARRGVWMLLPMMLRRCAMGTNQISCFGIWRQGARRQASRINRSGETRWHRCAPTASIRHSHTHILGEKN